MFRVVRKLSEKLLLIKARLSEESTKGLPNREIEREIVRELTKMPPVIIPHLARLEKITVKDIALKPRKVS